ncbi:hypothetical protein [Sphingobacterium hungaricum]|uniref:Uncharacterized protein n=1 Tax=Sphingobacterium hungaricum TaxID=2082723 RepID=A0A928YPY5_9SPHI|nr:hypothetical protein [Sphingobacterium hungaricum]MBE8713384.1 hypothetical protein [Sphingobacterium hungaricum]
MSSYFFIFLGLLGIIPTFQSTGYPPYSGEETCCPNQNKLDTITKDTVAIDEILVERKLKTSLEKFEQKKEDHRIIYLLGDNKNPFIITPIGIGANLNRIYNHFSKSGKQSRKLQGFFENEYEDDLINDIWEPYTEEFSGLSGDSLSDFRVYYKPKLDWLSNASHYDKLYYIKINLKNYLDSVGTIREKLKLEKE